MHRAQQVIKRGMGRFNVVNAGRRFGKDILGQDRAVYFALKQGAPVAWMAPTYRMLADNYRMLADTLAPVTTRKLNNTRIDLISGGFIDFWSLENPDKIRGRKYQHIIVNEAAMVAGLRDAFDMIIRPTLTDLRGSMDLYSTPKGLNDFYNFYAMAVEVKDWERFRYTSYDNPHIPADELDAMRSSLPERVFSQEIMAEFVEDGAFFQGIDQAAVVEHRDEPGDHAGHRLFMASDWAKFEDYSVFVIGCQDCNRVVDWWRGNRIDYTYQRERMVRMFNEWECVGALPERNSIGEPNIEILRQSVKILTGPDGFHGYNTTATTKPPLMDGLSSAFENHGFKVPREAREELLAYQVTLSANNRYQYSAPDGQHDDWVMALAILWYAMSKPTGVFFA